MPACPIYTTIESVKIRLAGKVAFQSGDVPTQREMPNDLLLQLIVDAETAVEQDLRGRYYIPLQSIKFKNWQGLPDHSKRAIRTIVDHKACIFILGESFGAGTHINADGYLKSLNDNYTGLLRRLMGQDLESSEYGERRFRSAPPLEDLRLSLQNVADTGYRGAPIDAGYLRPNLNRLGDRLNPVDYAAEQINDPSRGLFGPGGRYGSR